MNQETLKKIVELVDGFEWIQETTHFNWCIKYKESGCISYQALVWEHYPLLLRRALGGLNPQWFECKIELDHIDITRMNPDDNYKAYWIRLYFYKNYPGTDYLTPQEAAIEACLIELLS